MTRRATRCLACELMQYVAEDGPARCRRCGKTLLSMLVAGETVAMPTQETQRVTKQAIALQAEAVARPGVIAFGETLPTVDEVIWALVLEAVARYGHPVKAGARTGMPKTTLYRWLREARENQARQQAEVTA